MNYYKEIPVWEKFPDWKTKPKEELIWTPESLGDIGFIYQKYYASKPVTKKSFGCSFIGGDAIKEANELFDLVKGRYGSLWFPSWVDNFKISADVGAADVILTIGLKYYSNYYPYPGGHGRYIFIYVNKNQWYIRKINSAVGSTITIDSALGVSLTTTRIKMACFLYLGRFDMDTINWTYISPEPNAVAEAPFYFIETPEEYADLP